jgi:ribonuclease-3
VNHLLTGISDEIGRPNRAEAINQLETLSRRGYFPLPEYSYTEGRGKDGNSTWSCVCSIDGVDRQFRSRSSSKKEAKKSAAYKMLKYMIQES